MKEITNLADSFTEKEIEFMVEFKKIYELGLNQLEKFIDKLDKEGNELDTYSITYYVDILNNGPLGSYVRQLSKDKKYFLNTPDTLGNVGNKNRTASNVTAFLTDDHQLGTAVDTYNKLPGFIQETLKSAIEQTENVFRSSLNSSMVIDNTLPIVDKSNQMRHDEEPSGKWVFRSNGNFLVKDSQYYTIIDEISTTIFDKIKQFLGEENFRIYKDKKEYSPFDSEKNQSEATNNKINKNITVGDTQQEVTLDLMGDEFDSVDRRNSVLKIENEDKDKEYKLYTVKGQLGS